jgi:hypothetical protein
LSAKSRVKMLTMLAENKTRMPYRRAASSIGTNKDRLLPIAKEKMIAA